MLKKYIDGDSDCSATPPVNIVNSVPHEQNQTDFEEMNSLSHYPKNSKQLEYEHLFPDIPSKTDKIYLDVDIIEGGKPDKQHPYTLHPERQQYLRKEVKYLLDNDFIL